MSNGEDEELTELQLELLLFTSNAWSFDIRVTLECNGHYAKLIGGHEGSSNAIFVRSVDHPKKADGTATGSCARHLRPFLDLMEVASTKNMAGGKSGSGSEAIIAKQPEASLPTASSKWLRGAGVNVARQQNHARDVRPGEVVCLENWYRSSVPRQRRAKLDALDDEELERSCLSEVSAFVQLTTEAAGTLNKAAAKTAAAAGMKAAGGAAYFRLETKVSERRGIYKVALADLVRAVGRAEGGAHLAGHPLWIYWYEQPVDMATPGVNELWIPGEKDAAVGLWYLARVTEYRPASGEVMIQYAADGQSSRILLPLVFAHWGARPPSRLIPSTYRVSAAAVQASTGLPMSELVVEEEEPGKSAAGSSADPVSVPTTPPRLDFRVNEPKKCRVLARNCIYAVLSSLHFNPLGGPGSSNHPTPNPRSIHASMPEPQPQPPARKSSTSRGSVGEKGGRRSSKTPAQAVKGMEQQQLVESHNRRESKEPVAAAAAGGGGKEKAGEVITDGIGSMGSAPGGGEEAQEADKRPSESVAVVRCSPEKLYGSRIPRLQDGIVNPTGGGKEETVSAAVGDGSVGHGAAEGRSSSSSRSRSDDGGDSDTSSSTSSSTAPSSTSTSTATSYETTTTSLDSEESSEDEDDDDDDDLEPMGVEDEGTEDGPGAQHDENPVGRLKSRKSRKRVVRTTGGREVPRTATTTTPGSTYSVTQLEDDDAHNGSGIPHETSVGLLRSKTLPSGDVILLGGFQSHSTHGQREGRGRRGLSAEEVEHERRWRSFSKVLGMPKAARPPPMAGAPKRPREDALGDEDFQEEGEDEGKRRDKKRTRPSLPKGTYRDGSGRFRRILAGEEGDAGEEGGAPRRRPFGRRHNLWGFTERVLWEKTSSKLQVADQLVAVRRRLRHRGQQEALSKEIATTTPAAAGDEKGLVFPDLSRGAESIPIPVFNTVDDAICPGMDGTGWTYIRDLQFAPGLYNKMGAALSYASAEMALFLHAEVPRDPVPLPLTTAASGKEVGRPADAYRCCGLACNQRLMNKEQRMQDDGVLSKAFKVARRSNYSRGGLLLAQRPLGLHECSDACVRDAATGDASDGGRGLSSNMHGAIDEGEATRAWEARKGKEKCADLQGGGKAKTAHSTPVDRLQYIVSLLEEATKAAPVPLSGAAAKVATATSSTPTSAVTSTPTPTSAAAAAPSSISVAASAAASLPLSAAGESRVPVPVGSSPPLVCPATSPRGPDEKNGMDLDQQAGTLTAVGKPANCENGGEENAPPRDPRLVFAAVLNNMRQRPRVLPMENRDGNFDGNAPNCSVPAGADGEAPKIAEIGVEVPPTPGGEEEEFSEVGIPALFLSHMGISPSPSPPPAVENGTSGAAHAKPSPSPSPLDIVPHLRARHRGNPSAPQPIGLDESRRTDVDPGGSGLSEQQPALTLAPAVLPFPSAATNPVGALSRGEEDVEAMVTAALETAAAVTQGLRLDALPRRPSPASAKPPDVSSTVALTSATSATASAVGKAGLAAAAVAAAPPTLGSGVDLSGVRHSSISAPGIPLSESAGTGKSGLPMYVGKTPESSAPRTTCKYNREVTRGIELPLQIFRTADRRWGVRCAVEIPKGAFVGAFIGEVQCLEDLPQRRREVKRLVAAAPSAAGAAPSSDSDPAPVLLMDHFSLVYQAVCRLGFARVMEGTTIHRLPPPPFTALCLVAKSDRQLYSPPQVPSASRAAAAADTVIAATTAAIVSGVGAAPASSLGVMADLQQHASPPSSAEPEKNKTPQNGAAAVAASGNVKKVEEEDLFPDDEEVAAAVAAAGGDICRLLLAVDTAGYGNVTRFIRQVKGGASRRIIPDTIPNPNPSGGNQLSNQIQTQAAARPVSSPPPEAPEPLEAITDYKARAAASAPATPLDSRRSSHPEGTRRKREEGSGCPDVGVVATDGATPKGTDAVLRSEGSGAGAENPAPITEETRAEEDAAQHEREQAEELGGAKKRKIKREKMGEDEAVEDGGFAGGGGGPESDEPNLLPQIVFAGRCRSTLLYYVGLFASRRIRLGEELAAPDLSGPVSRPWIHLLGRDPATEYGSRLRI